jgi:CRISPR/Cas system-associated endonuclease Cas1
MVNEYVYCPRLFFYEWVEGLFRESADTVEGKLQHKRVDKAVDSAVINAINTRMVTASDFLRSGDAVALTPNGRKSFYHAYELRMDTLVTHPIFEYRVSYRRLLEVQARLLARVLEGEIGDYPVFVTR